MFVSHFNSFLAGGASTAAQRLHQALLHNGTHSRFQYLEGQKFTQRTCAKSSETETVPQGLHETTWHTSGLFRRMIDAVRFRIHRQRFKRQTRSAKPGSEIFTSPHGQPSTLWPPIDHPTSSHREAPQHVIQLHWISKFLDYPSFFGSLPLEQPVIWTLHDMNALTGGCHFSGGCERFRAGCGNCPQLNRGSQNDASSRSFQTKRAALKGVNLHIVAPSRWLLELAKESPLLSDARSFTRIPYGMPTDKLRPIATRSAKAQLGIDADTFVIGFGAMDLGNRRKGAAELLTALEILGAHSNVQCLVFGSGRFADTKANLPPMINVGKVENDSMRRLVYSAADVFMLPSTEDNLPLTGLEAMACGTPVIGFDAGGIPDYVIPGQTGMLARNGDSAELAQRLKTAILNPTALGEMGDRSRRLILDQFESNLEAQRYMRLYRRVLGTSEQADRRAA